MTQTHTPCYQTKFCSVDSALHHQLGCVKGFIYMLQVNSTVRSVHQKMRHLPLSICKEVSAELNCLLQAGIIDCVDASEWVSTLFGGMETQRKAAALC